MIETLLTSQEYQSKYEALRKQINFPFKIELYFCLMESAMKGQLPSKNAQQSQSFSPLFLAYFSRMSQLEKSYFLLSNIEYIKKQQERNEGNTYEIVKKSEYLKRNISVGGQMAETMMGLTYWTAINFTLVADKKQIRVTGKKDTIILDLRLYLVRKSKKYKNTLVLEAVQETVPMQQKKLTFFFKGSIFNEVYQDLFKTVIEYRNQQILKMVTESKGTNQANNMQISFISKTHKALMFLNSKNVNDFINYKDTILKKIMTSNFSFKPVYKLNNCTIERSQKHSNYYKLQTVFQEPAEVLKHEFLKKYEEQCYTYLMQSQVLQTFSNKYAAIYSKHVFSNATSQGSKIVQHIFIQEKSNKSLEEVLFMKGLENIMSKKSIQFVFVKIKSISEEKSKLIVFSCFSKHSKMSSKGRGNKFKSDLAIMFLTEFSNMLFRNDEVQHLSNLLIGRELNQNPDSDEFRTVQGNFERTKYHNDEIVEEIDDELDSVSDNFTQQNQSISNSVSFKVPQSPKIKKQSQSQKKTYLSHQFVQRPLSPSMKKEVVSQHFLFSEWNRKFTGGIVCKDSSPISEQKKVFKHILTAMGKNVLHNKGLLNVSLPVNIFKTESHLQSIARNFGFAPILLEKAVPLSSLQKMKYSILFALSVSSLSISISKPFNPILGETLQIWIDGCPMYLQQISHHPPVSSYYFVGRGYKIYGKIASKANFGFNTIYGYSDQPNFILFDDGTQIQLNFSKMAIKGILFGDREFNFTQKMYAFDAKNKVFSLLTFGDQNKGFFSNNSQPTDYFEGKISCITDEFVNQFAKKPHLTPPSSADVIKNLSEFEGIWNGRIFFDEQQYIDFSRENPCKLKDEEMPLASNSTYREDIVKLQEGNLEGSQNAKEILEEIQRRDRKLRLKFNTK